MIGVGRWIRPLLGPLLGSLGISAALLGLRMGASWFHQAQAAVELPVAPARKGEFLVIVRCRGDVKAGHSVPIYAPVVPNLTIAWLAPAGEAVDEGQPIIRFDSSSAQQQLL